jgi:hypothetical protein
MKTQVKFKKFKNDIIAIFPNELYNEILYGKEELMSYMTLGQHGACCRSLLKLKNANSEEYSSLKKELELIGYDLEVLNKG